METVKSYKCPSCGAPLEFNAENQNLHCESCGTDFALDTLKELYDAENSGMTSSKYDWESYSPRDFNDNETKNLSSYSCPSCGAEITGDDSLGSTVCPYCGNATIIKGQFEGSLKPDYIIPFKIDKKTAMSEFEKAYNNAPFLPDEFKNKKKIEEMAGVYVPFWMFDCDCNANIRYNAQRITTWSDSDYDYTRTDFYKLIRAGSIGFQNIPVDASKKADDAYMEAVEPFDYNDAVNFDTVYLSGYLADKYDVGADESITRANERVKQSTEDAFSKTAAGFGVVTPEASYVDFSNGKIRYSLLPVWMLNIKYKGENYKFAINGQTGKTVGKYPVDNKKKWTFFGIVYAIAFVICIILSIVLGLF
ncbi:MAG: hypothetical protein ACI4VF_09415 [Lachnospirales bacterium]